MNIPPIEAIRITRKLTTAIALLKADIMVNTLSKLSYLSLLL